MAKEVIGVGTVANDGTGDTLRASMVKANTNFTGLFNVLGWGNYVEDQTTPSTQVISSTASKLQIDGGSALSESGYLPYEIRGVSELWDTVNNKILPIAVGDAYTFRLDFDVTAKSGSPNGLFFQLDIGGDTGVTNPIVNNLVLIDRTPPFSVSIGMPVFTLGTFLSNGGQIFLNTDTGTVTLTDRSINIHRISSGAL